MSARTADKVLLTDHAWPDLAIEREIIEGAGFRLVAGPPEPSPAEAIDALAREVGPAAIMTCWAQVSAQAIAACPQLRVVARMGIGLDNIAVEEATRRGILVTNVPDYCIEEVSDHAIGLLLALVRGIVHFDREVKAGRWEPAKARLRRVRTLTCGLIGYGRTGRRTAEKLTAGFGVKVLAHDPFAQHAGASVELVALDALLERAYAVIVHAPLTSDTRNLLDAKRIARMRQGALLINVSRGGVVDTQAVIEALQSGHLGGVGLDVLESEPAVPPALAARGNVILTPHIAFTSDSALEELRRGASEDVVRVLRGEAPLNACNQPRAPARPG